MPNHFPSKLVCNWKRGFTSYIHFWKRKEPLFRQANSHNIQHGIMLKSSVWCGKPQNNMKTNTFLASFHCFIYYILLYFSLVERKKNTWLKLAVTTFKLFQVLRQYLLDEALQQMHRVVHLWFFELLKESLYF